MRQAMGTRWEKLCETAEWDTAANVSPFQIPVLTFFLFSIHTLYMHSFVCSFVFTPLFLQPFLWSSLWVQLGLHFFTPVRGEMWLFDLPQGSSMKTLCICACEIYSHLSHYFIWYSAGGGGVGGVTSRNFTASFLIQHLTLHSLRSKNWLELSEQARRWWMKQKVFTESPFLKLQRSDS